MTATLLGRLAQLAPRVLPFAPLLGAVANVEVPSTPEADAIADRHRPDRTADVVIELLGAGSPGPLVVVMEDAQRVDEVHRPPPGSPVFGHRSPALAGRGHAVRDSDEGFTHPEGDRLTIGPLPDATVRALTDAATEVTPLRPHEVDA